MNKTNNNFDVTILVISCDAYSDLWRPFFHCFFKYWPDCSYPVSLASNLIEYKDSRVRSILIGPDKDYSSNLIHIINQIETSWIILWVEDGFITSRINNDLVQHLIDDAQKNNVGYLKLVSTYPWAYTKDKNQMSGPLPKGIKYRSGFGMALWKKETIFKLLRPGESAWQIDKNSRSDELVEPFFALTTNLRRYPPIPVINSVIKGKWNYGAKRILKKEGLADCISSRSSIPLKTFLYNKLYCARLDMFRLLGKYWY